MDILNRTPLTYTAFIALKKAASPHEKRFKIFAVLLGIVTLLPCLSHFSVILRGDGTYLNWITVVCSLAVVLGCIVFLLPLYQIRARRLAARNTVLRYTFSEDSFAYEDPDQGPMRFRYEDLVKITESKHYYFLFYTVNAVMIVAKEGFSVGDERDFRELLGNVIHAEKLHIN